MSTPPSGRPAKTEFSRPDHSKQRNQRGEDGWIFVVRFGLRRPLPRGCGGARVPVSPAAVHCERAVRHGGDIPMNWRPLASLLGVAALALGACQQSNPATTSGGKALIAEPTTGVTFSEDFNPYDSNSVTSAMGTRSLVNEPLIEFDQLDATPAGAHPWLATAYAFQNGGKDLQVTIRENVKFSDGSAFAPADVAATF